MEFEDWANQKLKTIPAFQLTGGVEELEEAEKLPLMKLKVPAAFVLVLAENAGQNLSITVTSQRVEVSFAIVIAVANTLNPLGQNTGARSRRQEMRKLVSAAFLGVEPVLDVAQPQTAAPIEFVRGRLVRIKDNVLWWQDDFRFDYYARG